MWGSHEPMTCGVKLLNKMSGQTWGQKKSNDLQFGTEGVYAIKFHKKRVGVYPCILQIFKFVQAVQIHKKMVGGTSIHITNT